jgi:hypothetical protein
LYESAFDGSTARINDTAHQNHDLATRITSATGPPGMINVHQMNYANIFVILEYLPFGAIDDIMRAITTNLALNVGGVARSNSRLSHSCSKEIKMSNMNMSK